jgi:hypothetical protein
MADVLSGYEDDDRELHGPIVHRDVTPGLPYAFSFVAGFCPRCLSRLAWNRTFRMPDELEDQCENCLTVWREPEAEARS